MAGAANLFNLIVQFLFQELAEREDILKFWKSVSEKIPFLGNLWDRKHQVITWPPRLRTNR